MGLETEYAVRFRPREGLRDRPSDYSLYQRLVSRLGQLLPTANAAFEEPAEFLATGGAVRFERFWQARPDGLIEGATPECRSPRDLLVWQRAQDTLFSRAAGEAGQPDGEFVLLKNNRDSRGTTYGSHENYQSVLATGWRWLVWRVGLVLLLPLLLLEWVLLIGLFVPCLLLYWMAGGVAWRTARVVAAQRGKPRPSSRSYLGDWFETDSPSVAPWPPWLEPVVIAGFVIVLFPFGAAMWLLLRVCAFAPQRKALLPFLITRTVLSGSGWLDSTNRFHVAQKAGAVNCRTGFYAVFDRPIFSFGHLLEASLLLLSPSRYRRLFQPAHRIQICVGDSNRCEEAEYLRIATTALVLDAAEAGALPGVPRIWRPLRTLKRVARDVELQQPAARWRGRRLNALEVQRFYLNACRDYVVSLDEPPPEAWDLLERWDDVLTRLEDDRRSLVGRVDWITKQFLLDSVGDVPAESRKKIDLRYHEVSPAGYFEQLQQAGIVRALVSEAELESAMRNAPATSPAAVRGRYIREFAGGSVALKVDWHRITIGEGSSAWSVPLDSPSQNSPPPQSGESPTTD